MRWPRVQAIVRKAIYAGSIPARISNMTPAEYIIQTLRQLKTKKSEFRENEEELSIFVYKLLMSKKFRKYSPGPEYSEHILSVIENNISENKPIQLNLVFGGYKLWRLEESPEVDWAELFAFIYYTKWLKPICAIYKQGVWLDFFSDDVVLEIINNIPTEDTQKYLRSFDKLLKFIKPYIPENLNFTLNRVADQYKNFEEFKKDLELSIQKYKNEELKGKLPKLTPQQIATIELNVKLKPDQDKDPNWREQVAILHDGYQRLPRRRPYYRNSEKIMIAATPINNSLAVGTTKTSVMKFWVGAGVLEKKGGTYVENIFSPKQLASKNVTKEEVFIEGLKSKNFQTIKVVVN